MFLHNCPYGRKECHWSEEKEYGLFSNSAQVS
jgi:hypothetical protein